MRNFLLILLAFVALNTSAQIQRKIFGCTLGVTRYNQVEKILEANYENPYFDGSRTYFHYEHIEYGGYKWYDVTFNFYNKVLSSVTFRGMGWIKYGCDFHTLEKSLQSRYGKYKVGDRYDDGTVIIETNFFYKNDNDYNSATITYKYKPFVIKKQQEDKNAW